MDQTICFPESLTQTDGCVDVRWFWSPGDQPLSNVRLTLQNQRLMDIGCLPPEDRSNVLPLICIPPLVNAHTHLEFSGLRNPLHPPTPFPSWIEAVIAFRSQQLSSGVQAEVSIQNGLEEIASAGVQAVGEISTQRLDAESFSKTTTDFILFREFIGLSTERVQESLGVAKEFIASVRTAGIPNLRPGLSPHAPYSVCEELFEGLVELARSVHVPLAMHLAETREEIELLSSGTGPFQSFLQDRGLWRPAQFPGGRRILPFFRSMARLQRSLAVHCNYLTKVEIEFLGGHPMIRVVYCPRTHRYFGHAEHPWKEIVRAGGVVLIGTDSRASNPDLDLWKDWQLAAQDSDGVTDNQLLEMITSSAAEVLGLDPIKYRQVAGEPWNATLIRIPEDHSDFRPAALSPDSKVVAVVHDGVFRQTAN
ncbi:MAG: amidohydrolase family protein [Planctomyces sp.]|nr:amidohydrolase family protein [Planctomyces sp.]